MEQRKTVHYEIQAEKKGGEWTSLLQQPLDTEKEILELRDRTQKVHPREKIRAVKVTTVVTLEEVCEESLRSTIPVHLVNGQDLHEKLPAKEVLQDCD